MRIGIMLALAVLPALGQEIKWPASFEKLAAKAKESVDVNLDGNMLQMAGRFLSPDKPGEAKARGVIAGLKGVFVKNFEFEKEGEYTQADVDGVRGQLKGPGWSKVVSVIEKRESTEIFVKQENGKPAGMVIEEFQRGYRMGARLLRPAMVAVATPPRAPEPAPAVAEGSGGEQAGGGTPPPSAD